MPVAVRVAVSSTRTTGASMDSPMPVPVRAAHARVTVCAGYRDEMVMPTPAPVRLAVLNVTVTGAAILADMPIPVRAAHARVTYCCSITLHAIPVAVYSYHVFTSDC